jgi:hypothetical protein
MRKFSAALVAVLLSAQCALFAPVTVRAANLPLFPPTQPLDASQILPTINTLIQSINAGVAGEISSSPVQATTTGTTIQTLGTGTIPGGTLVTAGQAVRAKCFGSGGATGTNTLTVQVGSSAAFAVTGAVAGAFGVDVLVFKTGPNTQQILTKGQFNATPAAQTIVSGANNDTNPISIVCSGTSTTTGQFTLNGLIVEQIK